MYCTQMKAKKIKSIFSQRLIALRKAKGLTQLQLAKALNVSRDTISYYEIRAKNPTHETVQVLADFFGVPCDQLLASEIQLKKKPGPVSKLQKQFQDVQHLPKEEQKFVSKFLDQFLVNTAK